MLCGRFLFLGLFGCFLLQIGKGYQAGFYDRITIRIEIRRTTIIREGAGEPFGYNLITVVQGLSVLHYTLKQSQQALGIAQGADVFAHLVVGELLRGLGGLAALAAYEGVAGTGFAEHLQVGALAVFNMHCCAHKGFRGNDGLGEVVNRGLTGGECQCACSAIRIS